MSNAPTSKIKYLTNKDLLEEIHRSKKTYCEFTAEEYGNYDFIVTDLSIVTEERIQQAREKRYSDTCSKMKKEAVSKGIKNPQIQFDIATITPDSIVIRLMTFDHIPINEEKLHKAKTEAERHIKCNFPPFQHFIYRGGEFLCVGKSHWQGGLENGHFCNTHGKITNRLALMFMKLVERYSHRGNWRGYTYNDEMRSQALLQLSQMGLQFDESKSDTPNPFAYFTAAVNNSFTRILNLEKRSQNIRDDLLIMHGAMPSYTRQTEQDIAKTGNVVATSGRGRFGRGPKKVVAVVEATVIATVEPVVVETPVTTKAKSKAKPKIKK